MAVVVVIILVCFYYIIIIWEVIIFVDEEALSHIQRIYTCCSPKELQRTTDTIVKKENKCY